MRLGLKIVIWVVVAALLVGAIVGVVSWTQSDKFDQKTLSYIGRYKIGGLDSNGNYSNVNTSVYTADPFECQGLNCTLDFDAEITYEIFFYDQNKDFVHRTGSLEKSFVEDSVPFFVKYARIVITPKDDNKVTALEKDKYAKQLTVKVNREQGFKNYTENLVSLIKGKTINLSTGAIENAYVSDSSSEIDFEHVICDYINISSYKECLVFRENHSDFSVSPVWFFFYNAEKSFMGKARVADVANLVFSTSEGVKYYCVPVSALVIDNVQATFVCMTGSYLAEICCR